MNRIAGALGLLVVSALAIGFAFLNGNAWVTIDLGIVTLYRISLTAVVFGSLILGMGVMLVAGVHSDRKVRRILRDRLASEDERERAQIFVDRTQHDLFEQPRELRREGGQRSRVASGTQAAPRRPVVPIQSLAPDVLVDKTLEEASSER